MAFEIYDTDVKEVKEVKFDKIMIKNYRILKAECKEATEVYASKKINSPECLVEFINAFDPYYKLQQTESLLAITLDTKNNIIGIYKVFEGSLNKALVEPREIFQRAIIDCANSIMVVHNHPTGDPKPSGEDIKITRRLAECGDIIGIRLLDQIIIGGDDFISLRREIVF